MRAEHKGRTFLIEGDWPARYLFLAPIYALSIDGAVRDRGGGARVRTTLESGDVLVAIRSWTGLRPIAHLFVDGELVASGRVRPQNLLHPALALFIIATIGVMLYVGPGAIRALIKML